MLRFHPTQVDPPRSRTARCRAPLGIAFVAAACLLVGCPSQRSSPTDALLAAPWTGPLVMDGRLEEAGWKTAGKITLRRSDGRAEVRQPTYAYAAWNPDELLLAFHCTDDDIRSTYRKRDDPLYMQEAVEVFLDPDGDQRDYMEFEVSPGGVRFDASFTGRRQGMDLAFNPDSRVAVAVGGTLDRRGDEDQAWSVEMAIPFVEMTGRGRRPPKAGDCWRANFFRLDKSAKGGEASAWRPTAGDFHDLGAFGPLCFSDHFAR
jgi:Carbohydrate family 9 binding domain-like